MAESQMTFAARNSKGSKIHQSQTGSLNPLLSPKTPNETISPNQTSQLNEFENQAFMVSSKND